MTFKFLNLNCDSTVVLNFNENYHLINGFAIN